MSNIEIPEFLKNQKKGASAVVIGAGMPRPSIVADDIQSIAHNGPECAYYVKPTDMTKADVEALSCKIRAMSREEWEVVLDNIPVEMMLPRIESELRKRQAFIDRINGVTDAFGR